MPALDPRAPTSIADAYDALIEALSMPVHAGVLAASLAAHRARTGSLDDDDDGFEARMSAFWDHAVTDEALLGAVAAAGAGPLEPWLSSFRRAHRGLFAVAHGDGGPLELVDAWSGASFLLLPTPPEATARALRTSEGLFDGRLVATREPLAVALLPGAFFHPPDATAAIRAVLTAAASRDLATHVALDALIAMEARLRGHSRVKPQYAYRVDRLPAG